MDDTENTESQTNESQTESQTDDTNDTSSNSEPSFSSDALNNNNDTGPNFDLDWSGWENSQSNNDTGDNDTSDDNREAAQAWVDMHQHYDWGSGLTVDDVFNNDNVDNGYNTGDTTTETNNQSRTETQGDYDTSSKENSNVQTTTVGKQDEITTTPDTITENKGVISNSNIQSVEGLDFQQKDKEDLTSKKERDKAEEEDKSEQIMNNLRAEGEKTAAANKENKENKEFQIGNKDKKEKELEDTANAATKNRENLEKELEEANKQKEELEKDQEELNKQADDFKKEIENTTGKNIFEVLGVGIKGIVDYVKDIPEGIKDIPEAIKEGKITIDTSKLIEGFSNLGKDTLSLMGVDPNKLSNLLGTDKNLKEKIEENSEDLDELSKGLEDAKKAEEAANKELEDYRGENNTDVIPENPAVPEEKPEITEDTKIVPEELPPEEKPAVPEVPAVPEENTEKTEKTEKSEANKVADGLRNKANENRNKIENGNYKTEKERRQLEKEAEKAEKQADALDNLDNSEKKVNNAAQPIIDKGIENCTPEEIKTYVDAVEEYNNNLKEANALSNKTDYDKTYTSMVAKSNDFTLPNGQKYSDFAIDMATKSPAIAKGLYEAKANEYKAKAAQAAKDENKVSAWWNNTMSKIESLKANMSQNFIGSKLTSADNKVRDQFNQMAKTNMKATYAAYNNVLNNQDKYSPEYVAAAKGQIAQANALMTASTALKASTGAFSGLGDSVKDGKYGTTDPEALNAYQKTLNALDNTAKITLGLGVLPGANEAYQNMYYMAGGKVENSLLFNKDFDKDGFALCQEYGNNAAVGMITGAGQLSVGVALVFASPLAISVLSKPIVSNLVPLLTKGAPINSITELGIQMITDGIETFGNSLWGVKREVDKSIKLNNEITSYLEDARNIVSVSNNQQAKDTIDNAIKEITTKTEDFKINSNEVGNLDNWLEGSGSNTADNGKFNQALSYEDWLKLIQADPAMQEYAKKLAAEKNKNAQEGNVNT